MLKVILKIKKEYEIEEFRKSIFKNNEYLFHAGTKLENNKIIATGGRVLNFVSLSENFKNLGMM